MDLSREAILIFSLQCLVVSIITPPMFLSALDKVSFPVWVSLTFRTDQAAIDLCAFHFGQK